mgnify:CR=1 FL=1
MNESSYPWTGEDINPSVKEVQCKINNTIKILNENDYEIDESSHEQSNAGKYTLKINGKGNYTGSASTSWQIEGTKYDATLTMPEIIYGNKNYEPTVNGYNGDESITYTYHNDIQCNKKRSKPYKVGTGDRKVALLDFGAKKNIAKSLANRNMEVTVYPASTPASTIIEGNYDGVMLSNGPGDPSENVEIIKEVKKPI